MSETSTTRMPLLKSAIGRFRVIGFVEGVSYIVLVFVAMPLKYLAGMPLAVKITGSLHGALFVLFGLALVDAMRTARFSLVQSGLLFGASLVPFGTFVSDPWLKRREQAMSAQGHQP
jgi:integral membrane protein